MSPGDNSLPVSSAPEPIPDQGREPLSISDMGHDDGQVTKVYLADDLNPERDKYTDLDDSPRICQVNINAVNFDLGPSVSYYDIERDPDDHAVSNDHTTLIDGACAQIDTGTFASCTN